MKYQVGDYKTRGNIEAKILMIDKKANYPLIGAIKCKAGWWVTAAWCIDGKLYVENEEYPDVDYFYDEEKDESYSNGDLPDCHSQHG